MRKIVYLLFFSFFVSCQNDKPSSVTNEEKPIEKQEEKPVPVNVTTAEPMICAYLGGPPFELDTLTIIDSIELKTEELSRTAYLNFTAYFPQSNLDKHQHLNTTVRDLVNKYYQEHNLKESPMDIDAEIWVSDYSWNGDLVSFVFTEQDYYEGAAHYNHGYLSLNYDLKKNKTIQLTDVILFKEGEAQKFCDAFNPDPSTSLDDCQAVLEADDFKAERTFLINGDEIILFFDDYEKGPSMTKVYIPYSKIKGYVNSGYQILFQ